MAKKNKPINLGTIDLGVKIRGKYEIFKDYNGRPGKKIAETKNDIQWGIIDYFNTRMLYRYASGYYGGDSYNYHYGMLYDPRLFLGDDGTPQTKWDANDGGLGAPEQRGDWDIGNNEASAMGTVKGFVVGNFSRDWSFGIEAQDGMRRCLFKCNIPQGFTLREIGMISKMYYNGNGYYIGASRAALNTPVSLVDGDIIHVIYTIEFDVSASPDGWYLVGGGDWIDMMIGGGYKSAGSTTNLIDTVGISTDNTQQDPYLHPYDTTGYLTANTVFVGYETMETYGGKNIRATIWEGTIPGVPSGTYGNATFFWKGQSFLRNDMIMNVADDNSYVYFKIRVYFT